jgi:hypothetical protein
MKINFVYRTFNHLGSSLFGGFGLEQELKRQGVLHYSYNVSGDKFIQPEELQKYPVLFMRGGMSGMGPAIDACGSQFKASFESESYYTRHGNVDDPGIKDRLKRFDLVFTCAESDLNQFKPKTLFCPVWADIHGY